MNTELNNSIFHLDAEKNIEILKRKIKLVWNKYVAYNIYNLPINIDYVSLYEDIAESLGNVKTCHPVNNKSTKFSKSRDIKPDPNLYHYFASQTRQPLHSDYAYYEETSAPEWLMLYCLENSEYGGKTHILTVKTLREILKKYNPELLESLNIDVNWKYNGIDGDKEHFKPLLNGNKINWNYWQIKEDLNSRKVLDVKEKFHKFLEEIIVAGEIYDLSKVWKPGDCIIFNDKRVLHGRSAFLGNRWLKDHAIY